VTSHFRGGPPLSHRTALTLRALAHYCLQDYLAGRWPQARESFKDLLHARTTPEGMPCEDPPTKTLLGFMESHDFAAPEGWVGVRELTDK
jgi:hypothetical protein